MIGTYRGLIDKDHYLYNKMDIISTFYKEMYQNGRIEETSFDDKQVSNDKDSHGNVVFRNFGIHREHCQRAKILSSKKQRQARQDLLHLIKVNQYKSNQKLFESETKKYELNRECEQRIAKVYHIMTNSINIKNKQQMSQPIQSYTTIAQNATDLHFGKNDQKGLHRLKPTIEQLKAFIQLQHPIKKFAKNKPIYKSLTNESIKQLIVTCVECKEYDVLPRHFKQQIDPDA